MTDPKIHKKKKYKVQLNLEKSHALLHDGVRLAHSLGELRRSVNVGDGDHVVETEQNVARGVARL